MVHAFSRGCNIVLRHVNPHVQGVGLGAHSRSAGALSRAASSLHARLHSLSTPTIASPHMDVDCVDPGAIATRFHESPASMAAVMAHQLFLEAMKVYDAAQPCPVTVVPARPEVTAKTQHVDA